MKQSLQFRQKSRLLSWKKRMWNRRNLQQMLKKFPKKHQKRRSFRKSIQLKNSPLGKR